MKQLITLLLQHGLKPLLFDSEIGKLERKFTRSELIALILIKHKGQMTMSQLAAELGAPLSTVTSIGQRLKRRGFIERTRDPKDRRNIIIHLTENGEQLAQQLMELVNQVLKRIEQVLTTEEQEQLLTLIVKVMKAIQTMEPVEKMEQPTIRRINITE
ncbi:MarR family winged helix-turn-helix transcriptional regulator [Thermoflavimicrobium dichotomicum]|uniref:DNA-binding transcriptional regulator, MarR family n=1 Tax=Thermoflavimicrobium dichotomicum TaxID=46223 RepID=A0A1I3UPF2_9BACL|nr:MarR family transcriptional regulator [Thermoflavimicrobium dichotomicum]SFJ84569.1 DNA-binding transcriptional regulator, MarR family [Thermoflavimicrobium dichotomicum]